MLILKIIAHLYLYVEIIERILNLYLVYTWKTFYFAPPPEILPMDVLNGCETSLWHSEYVCL